MNIFPSYKTHINKIIVNKFDICSKLYRASSTLELRSGIIPSSSSNLFAPQLDLILFDTLLFKMSPRLFAKSIKTANSQLLFVIFQLFSDTFFLNINHHPQQHLLLLSLNYSAAGISLFAF